MKLIKYQMILTVMCLLAACTFQNNKVATTDGGFGKVCEPLSFAQVQAEVFGTPQASAGKCLACHVPGGPLLALDSFGAVKARLAQIEDSVRSGRMPKNAPLPAAAKQILYAWIQQGAPEIADAKLVASDCATVADPNPSPNPSLPPNPTTPGTGLIEPHYESLRKTIFASQCLDCHDSSGIFSSYDFSTYESLITYQKLFALPADGSDSRFVMSLVLGRMPRGKAPLPPEQIEIIRQWVALGLPKTASAIGVGVGDDVGDDACDLVDFQTVNTQVFQTSCTRCHDFTSKVDLQSYAKIKQHLSSVQWMIKTDKMPPKKPLSPELKDLVLKWIDQGAPETVVLPETCTPKGETP
jgi:cytochrome c553